MKDRKIFTVQIPKAEGNAFDWKRFKNRLDCRGYLFGVDFANIEQIGNFEKNDLPITHKSCPYCQGSAFKNIGVIRTVKCTNCGYTFNA